MRGEKGSGFKVQDSGGAIRRPVTWPGGKTKLAKWLLPLPPHVCHCEVFGGGLGLFFSKERSKVEVINDVHGRLVNVWRQLQGPNRGAVLKRLGSYLNSRALFAEWRRGSTDPVEDAAMFLALNRLSFGGDNLSFGVVKSVGSGARTHLQRLAAELPAACDRLQGVVIEELDWRRMLAVYDGPQTLFFLDPPYVGGAQGAYRSWSQKDMEEMAAAVAGLKGDWILTVNDSAEMRETFGAWPQQRISRQRGIRTGALYGELIVRKGGRP